MCNERYNDEEFIYGTQANDFLKQAFNKISAQGRVLCLAEGEGHYAVFLAEQGFEVTAVDMSEIGLRKAQKLAEARGVHITTQVAYLAEYDFGDNQCQSGHTCLQRFAKVYINKLSPHLNQMVYLFCGS